MNTDVSNSLDTVELIRQLAVHLVRDVGMSCRRVARQMGYGVSTICRWVRREAVGSVWRRRTGRPAQVAGRLTRNDVYGTLRARGGRISDQELMLAYPHVGRADLRRLKRRWRQVIARLRRRRLEQLTWNQPGSVWAMDFTEVAGGVEDLGKYLLVVRDLASGEVIDAAVCRQQNEAHALPVIAGLFERCGAPLVLKSDNGSAFVGLAARQLLDAHGVLPLFSPPGTPAYNGGCEAGIGSVKGRAQALASMRGGRAAMTLDDVYAAVAQIRAQPVTRHVGAPLRREAWASRAPVTTAMRAELRSRVAVHRAAACRGRGIASLELQPHALRASIDRFAIGRALRELRYLMTRRADFAA